MEARHQPWETAVVRQQAAGRITMCEMVGYVFELGDERQGCTRQSRFQPTGPPQKLGASRLAPQARRLAGSVVATTTQQQQHRNNSSKHHRHATPKQVALTTTHQQAAMAQGRRQYKYRRCSRVPAQTRTRVTRAAGCMATDCRKGNFVLDVPTACSTINDDTRSTRNHRCKTRGSAYTTACTTATTMGLGWQATWGRASRS